MKKLLIIIITILLNSCLRQEEPISLDLLKEIKSYIDKSESNAKERDTYFEHDIYLVIFSKKEALSKIEIFENNYYFKKELDGYITIGDNKVFFYNSNKNFVKKNLLKKDGLENIHNEESDEAFNSLDSEVLLFLIKEDNSLEKLNIYLNE